MGKKKYKYQKYVCKIFCIMMLVVGCSLCRNAVAHEQQDNHLDAVIVMDASGSMIKADPKGLRNEILRQFATLLTEQECQWGSVVFTDHIVNSRKVKGIKTIEEANQIVDKIDEIKADGDTNIAEALNEAIKILKDSKSGNRQAKVLLLTDGINDLPYAPEELPAVKERIRAAVDSAKNLKDKQIGIYTICLNNNDAADENILKEMSDETNCRCIEVRNRDDLQKALCLIYEIVNNAPLKLLGDSKIPNSGKLVKNIMLPAVDIEELDVFLWGRETRSSLISPKGNVINNDLINETDYRLLKTEEVQNGGWRIEITGMPGQVVKAYINCKPKFTVTTEVRGNKSNRIKSKYNPTTDSLDVFASYARLYDETKKREDITDGQFVRHNKGFKAELLIYDKHGDNMLYKIKMSNQKYGKYDFKVQIPKDSISQGVYKFIVRIATQTFEQLSEPTIVKLSNKYPSDEVVADTGVGDDSKKRIEHKSTKEENKNAIYLVPFFAIIAIYAAVYLSNSSQKSIGRITVYEESDRSIPKTSDIPGSGRLSLKDLKIKNIGLNNDKSYIKVTKERTVELITDKPVDVVEEEEPQSIVKLENGVKRTIEFKEHSLIIEYNSAK